MVDLRKVPTLPQDTNTEWRCKSLFSHLTPMINVESRLFDNFTKPGDVASDGGWADYQAALSYPRDAAMTALRVTARTIEAVSMVRELGHISSISL
jgi:hypothetical protein